ncbi:MAG: Hsp20/alpha crystallin family protein [Halanaerobiaceae bacterium]
MFDLVPFSRNRRGLSETDNTFDSLMSDFFNWTDRFETGFKTDIKETEEAYIIEAELAGMSKDDINIEVDEDNYLTIMARNEEVHEEGDDSYIRRERSRGHYARRFYLENVNEEEIEANYDNGILEVVLPKKEPTRAKKRTIDIN